MAHFIPTTERASEEDLVDLHMKHVWKLHGTALIHSTDRHGNFTSKYTQKMFKALGIEQRFSSGYHPQTQGQVENLNRWIETYLRMFCDHQKDDWADLLHTTEFAWNNHHHTSLDMTPFFANTGMHPTMTDVPTVGQYDTPKRIKRIGELREHLKNQLLKAQAQQAAQYNKRRTQDPIYQVGDKVYLSTDNLITNEGSKKLSDLRTGPFTVLKKVGDRAYKLKLPPHMKVNPTFNVSLLTRSRPDPILGRAPQEPAPIVVNGHKEYAIKRIKESNWLGKHFQYKVEYEGYGKEHDEWLFRDDLLEDLGEESLQDFEDKFYAKHPRARRYTDTVREREKGKHSIRRN